MPINFNTKLSHGDLHSFCLARCISRTYVLLKGKANADHHVSAHTTAAVFRLGRVAESCCSKLCGEGDIRRSVEYILAVLIDN